MRILREVAEIHQALLRYVIQANLAIQHRCEYLLEPFGYTTQGSLSGLVKDVFLQRAQAIHRGKAVVKETRAWTESETSYCRHLSVDCLYASSSC